MNGCVDNEQEIYQKINTVVGVREGFRFKTTRANGGMEGLAIGTGMCVLNTSKMHTFDFWTTKKKKNARPKSMTIQSNPPLSTLLSALAYLLFTELENEY
jgi:hypothetical protein